MAGEPQEEAKKIVGGMVVETDEGDLGQEEKLVSFIPLLGKKNIECRWVDAGDRNAGKIRVTQRPSNKEPTCYRILINQNHPAPIKFTTLAHELGHLFLSHLGPDKILNVPERIRMDDAQREIEAESVAFLVVPGME